jgi:hypothetical protein
VTGGELAKGQEKEYQMNLNMVTTRADAIYAIADNETSAKALVDEILKEEVLLEIGYGLTTRGKCENREACQSS